MTRLIDKFRWPKSCSIRSRIRCFEVLEWRHCLAANLVPVSITGPATNRVNAVFLGDGYTAADLAAETYANHVQNYWDYMFADDVKNDPFYRYRNFFNAYRVDVVSNQSGADEPQNHVAKDTALDATYRFDGVTDRLLYVSQSKADAAMNTALDGTGVEPQMRFVSVNDSVYGGGGGKYAVFAGANGLSREIALHELGHSFSGLADEYDYGGPTVYAGGEPSQIDVTTDPSGAKWSQWLGYHDPTGSVVGAYEGAMYSQKGIFRPTLDSKMRSLGQPFNAVSREKIILDVYSTVHPLDGYTGNADLLLDPQSISVNPVDVNVIDTQWFVDGTLVTVDDGLSNLNIGGLGLAPGQHTIEVRAFDPTGFDPVNGWVRVDTEKLEQFVTWSVTIDDLAPTADNSSVATEQDMPLSDQLAGHDADTVALVYSIVGLPQHGTITAFDPSTGAYTYAPNPHFHGDDSFTFTVADGIFTSDVATVSIHVHSNDETPPTSKVDSLAALSSSNFTVSWSGSDDNEGGEISYDVFASDSANRGIFTLFLDNTTDTSAVFQGVAGHTYGFYSVATDGSGNTESKAAAAEATTTVLSSNQVVLSGGQLSIGGTTAADSIAIGVSGTKLLVKNGTKTLSNNLLVSLIQQIQVFGRDGNDSITDQRPSQADFSRRRRGDGQARDHGRDHRQRLHFVGLDADDEHDCFQPQHFGKPRRQRPIQKRRFQDRIVPSLRRYCERRLGNRYAHGTRCR